MCLWQFNIHYASNSIFSGATLQDYICLLVQITNRWYVRNHFISNVLKKTKAIQFQHKHSNLLPRRQQPPSPRVAGTAVTSFPAKSLNCHISRTRHTRIPLFAPNWDLVSPILYTKNHVISYTGTLRIWPVFVPLWSRRRRAGKKVTAVTFFRCPTVKLLFCKISQNYTHSGVELRLNEFSIDMMTSSNRNICRVTGPLCGEFTGLRWIPRTKAGDAEMFSLICA